MIDMMRKVDLFWQSKDEWWEVKDGFPVVKKDAPPEAQNSYQRYLKQIAKD